MRYFLLLLPLFCFSQSYEEIITITDLQHFKKVMLENDYKKFESDSISITYAKGAEKDSLGNDVAYRWSSYHLDDGFWRIKISDGWLFDDPYNDLYNKVKDTCEFHKVFEVNDSVEAVSYKCNDAKFDGFLGFYKNDDGSGNIRYFPKPE